MIDPESNDGSGEPPPRPLLSPVFWLALLAALVCIVAGGTVAIYGPRLFPVHAKAAPQTPPATPARR